MSVKKLQTFVGKTQLLIVEKFITRRITVGTDVWTDTKPLIITLDNIMDQLADRAQGELQNKLLNTSK
jgi:hypothetical protein